jgi:hypothetical protein
VSALLSSVVSETETVFTMPSINYYAIAPILILFAAAVVSVLVEAFVPRGARRPTQLVLVFGSIIAALARAPSRSTGPRSSCRAPSW